MNKIKLAIIGIGHLGSRHLKVAHEMQDQVDLTGICDIKTARTKKLAVHYKVPYFKDYRTLADKAQAVLICVPTNQHYEIARYFLARGVHAFIEKPITPTLRQADALIRMADKNKVKLQVGHVERFNAAFLAIKHFARHPLFIECHRLNRFPNRSLDIGVVMDLMIHDIDIILGLNPSPIKNLHAVGINVLTPLEDISSARVIFKNGCVCNLTASRISDEVMRKIRIFLPEAYISLDYVNQEAYISKKKGKLILKHNLPIEKEEPLKKEVSAFIECIRQDTEPVVSGRDGREALKLALAITADIQKNKNLYRKNFLERASVTQPAKL